MADPTVNWITKVITVPQSYLTFISGVLYEFDVDAFRLKLRDLEDNLDGRPWQKTHNHNTEAVLSGVSYARLFEVLSPYTVEFEDGQYVIRCVGANHNLADVKVANQTSLIIGNSAGLQTVDTASSAQVWANPLALTVAKFMGLK